MKFSSARSTTTALSHENAAASADKNSLPPRTSVTPILLPSEAGLTTSGYPKAAARSVASRKAFSYSTRVTSKPSTVFSPAAANARLLSRLSIPIALAATPLPVYGIPAISSAP